MVMDKKIKIIHISIADSGGGAAIAAYRLHVLMNRSLRFDSTMLVLIKNTVSDSIFAVNLIQRQIARISLYLDKILTFNKRRSFGLFSLSFFGGWFNDNRIRNADVIYIHWINNGFLGMAEINNILKLGKPTFLFCHDMWFFSGGCHQSYNCKKFETVCCDCHFFRKNFIFDISKYCFNRKKSIYRNHILHAKFICPSSLWKNVAENSRMLPRDRVHYIPNVLDENKFKPLPGINKGVGSRPITVLFGALGGKSNPYKGWDYLVSAMDYLPRSLKDNIDVILFGYPFTQKELDNLEFNAFSAGVVDNEEHLIELYQRSHVFAFPSLQESFGQTLFEAMACGLPAVAFPVGIAEDLIDHKRNGYLAKYKDAADFAKGIEFIVENNNDALSIESRHKIIKEFSSGIIINKHFNLITNSTGLLMAGNCAD